LITIAKLPSCAPLAGIVRHFHAWTSSRLATPIRYPVAARPDLFIEFCFGEHFQLSHQVATRRSGPAISLPDAYVVGPRTSRRRDLMIGGNVDSFAIHFQPAGLSRLFGIPMQQLADRPHDAVDVFGKDWRILHGRLAEAGNLHARKAIAENFLLRCLQRADRYHPYQDVAAEMLRHSAAADLAELARRSHLSIRQFERKFACGVGVNPKLFQRVVRLNEVARAKMLDPLARWANLAQAGGYHDQMHLVRDFRQLTSATPSGFFEQRRSFSQWFI